LKRSYIDGPFGQIHIRHWHSDSSAPPIICLSPSPFSGQAYLSLAPLLAESRPVIAVDYPGYGNSDPIDSAAGEPQIADYAQAIAAVIDAISDEQSTSQAVDLLGFHTGCLVAVETARDFPEKVNRLVLVDVPFFSVEKQAELLEKMAKPVEIVPDMQMLAPTWDFCLANKVEHIPIARGYEIFVDHISGGEATNVAFKAAFQYPCEQRFLEVTHPTWVLATKAGLYENSCQTAELISSAKLVELTEIDVAVLDKGAPKVAQTVLTELA